MAPSTPRRATPAAGPLPTLALLGLALALATPPVAAQDAAPVRIAVLDLENHSGWDYWGGELGSTAADELATGLVRTGAFSVIERERLQLVLDEQSLGQSGAVDPSTAARIGEILGVQAIVTGSVTRFSMQTRSGGFGPVSASYSVADATLDLRVVDTNTAEIVAVAEGTGTKRFGGARYEDYDFQSSFDAGIAQEAVQPAVDEAIDELLDSRDRLASLAPVPQTGEVVGSNDGSVYIDRGENLGVEVGQRFDVYRVVDEIRDSDGNLLDRVTDKVGVIEVSRVLSQSAVCTVVEGEAREGDTVRSGG